MNYCLLITLLLLLVSYNTVIAGRWCGWAGWTGWAATSKWSQDAGNVPCYVGSFFSHRERTCSDSCGGGDCGTGDSEATKECLNHEYCAQQYCAPSDASHPPYECQRCVNSQSQWNDMCPGTTDPIAKCNTCRNYENSQGFRDAYCLKNGKCYAHCNWLGHDCWPGNCTKPEYLASSCQCQEGFILDTPDKETTKCKLVHPPEIETCMLGAVSATGEVANTTFSGNSTHCDNVEDTFINFEGSASKNNAIQFFSFVYDLQFKLPVDPPSGDDKHKHILDFHFGVIQAGVELRLHRQSGLIESLEYTDVQSTCTNANFSKEEPAAELPLVCKDTYAFSGHGVIGDAEKICHNFKAVGSGWLRTQDLLNSNTPSAKRFYDEIETTREVCFMTDFTPPAHCITSNPSCDIDLLQFGNRVKTTFNFTAETAGWFDPDIGSAVAGPSGIDYYEIYIYDMQHDHTTNEIYANKLAPVGHLNSKDGFFTISLPDRGPDTQAHMFALYLSVLDSTQESGNHRTTRRMVLVDNSSTIETKLKDDITVTSATIVENQNWQTNLNSIELDWTDHFHNTGHRTSNFLLPVRSDPLIDAQYDQNTGELPISGTPNVHGIVNTTYAFYRRTNNITSSSYVDVPNFTSQYLNIQELITEDGDHVDIDIRVKDIMNNTYIERVRVNVDSSPPILENIGIFKDHYKYLYVHNRTDLSHMDMRFDTYDPHSGMKQLMWSFGHTPRAHDVGSGSIGVDRINGSCPSDTSCYCPILGDCQIFHYAINLNPLIANDTHEGSHNRDYFFWIRVTNEAGLETEEEFQILVDDSAPEVGVVLDGPKGSKDRDFQSTPLVSWNWHGFIDHESGINKYHIAVGKRCFTKEELQFLFNFENETEGIEWFYKEETIHDFASFEVGEEGFYRLSVVALNNAMEPSDVACSSGVLYDTTPPVISHVDLIGVRGQPSIACSDNYELYYISPQRRIQELSFTEHCSYNLCNATYDLRMFIVNRLRNGSQLPAKDIEQSEYNCMHLPLLGVYENLFLPSDNLWLTWNASDGESQMLDFYIGLSSLKSNTDNPDVLGYQSTHNRTHYKCIHCGLGEGDMFYIMVKATNKAGLSTVECFGPVIIDMTPPVYQGGVNTAIDGDDITITWNRDDFGDAEDSDFIAEYYWALGTDTNLEEAETWRKIDIDHRTEVPPTLGFSYPVKLLQQHDQDMGQEYIFSIKAVNRAGLFHVESLAPMKIHSKVVPSCGVLQHVQNAHDTTEIGLQSSRNNLCVAWDTCIHESEDIIYSLGLGTAPGSTDIIAKSEISVADAELIFWCFENLSLDWKTKYYVSLSACNDMGCSEVNSKGVMVAQDYHITEGGIAVDGEGCGVEFQINIATDVVLDGINVFETTFGTELIALSDYTLKLTADSPIIWNDFAVKIDGIDIDMAYWTDDGTVTHLYYTFPLLGVTTNINIFATTPTTLTRIDSHQCNSNIQSQLGTSVLTARWSFEPWILKHISHYEINLYESLCTSTTCTSPVLVTTESTGKSLLHHFVDVAIKAGHKYNFEISPCFGATCASAIASDGVLIDPDNPLTQYITATMNIIHANGTRFHLQAEWETFMASVTPILEYNVIIYDWAIAQTPTGGSLLTNWERVKTDSPSNNIMVDTILELPVNSRRNMYLAIRPHSANHLASTEYLNIKVSDSSTLKPIEVFDLPLDYDLTSIVPYLHSSHVEYISNELHNRDIDFSTDTRRINGAAIGKEHKVSPFYIQSDSAINCFDKPSNIHCIQMKESKDNTIEFRYQNFEHGETYFICGYVIEESYFGKYSSIQACSNGFVIDTTPPLTGDVTAGTCASSTQTDNTMFYVKWNGFSDLEEETEIPYAFGIKEYQVALGTTPNGEDISQFETVGLSTHKIYKGLNLKSGRTYFATVQACDHVELCTTVSSNGVLIDSSPPQTGNVSITFIHAQLSKKGSDDIIVTYYGFDDEDSEIESYELGIGTTALGQDVKQFDTVEGGITTIDGSYHGMIDGYSYFIQIKAINRVGLWTIASSREFVYDSSVPTHGYVRWGTNTNQEPIKFTTDVNHLPGHWGGFTDPHTGIRYYRYAVGSAPGLADLLSWQGVGLHTDFEINFHLDPGFAYYLTVEACNGINLCTRDSSTGPLVGDTTAPLPGKVHVGMKQEHEQYQSNRHSISVKWFDFYDPESDIRRYHWCVGTSMITCDVISKQDAHLSLLAIQTGLNLPLGVQLYATVEAVNNAGLTITSSSLAFSIDTSAPLLVESPTALDNLGMTPSTRYDRSFISYKWKFTEDSTPIENHIISLSAHDDGIIPLNDIVVGDVNRYTHVFEPHDHLVDGTLYTFKVLACNAASICTAGTSDFLLDSSPPQLGGFTEPMHWRHESGTTIFSLLWTGFADPHSDIVNYKLMIGTTYNGHELSEGILEIVHDNLSSNQSTEVTINNVVQPDSRIFVSIWAMNGAGLMSDIGKTSMFLLGSGTNGGNKYGRLDTERHSCVPHYCTGDCTCAVLGRVCSLEHVDDCQDLTNYVTDNVLRVYINNTIYNGNQIASTACFAAHWTWDSDPNYLAHVQRFEWSISAKDAEPGVPIFNIIEDKHWFDVELQSNTVFCIPRTNQLLEHTYEYVFHLRAWHNYTFFTYVQSDDIFIDTSPPQINHAKSVRNMDTSFVSMITFTTSTNELYADWYKVFSDKESGINHYEVAFGYFKGGNEVFGPINLGLLTRISWTNLTLIPGYTYYTTVHAFNPLGMLVSMTSYGLTVDTEPPVQGVVHTSGDYQDQMYHSQDIVFTWQGFYDKHSYIKQYLYHLSTDENPIGNPADFIPNDIETELKIDINSLNEGVAYYLHVKGVDAASLESPIVTSSPVIVDTTAPTMFQCSEYHATESTPTFCGCEILIQTNTNKTCTCALKEITMGISTAYELELHFGVSSDEMEGRVQIGDFWDWLNPIRVDENKYKHVSKLVSNGDDVEDVVLHIFRGRVRNVTVELNKCSDIHKDPLDTGFHVRQVGPSELHFNWLIGDATSGIKRFKIGVGTTLNGYQLMPLTDVGTSNSLTISTQLQHKMPVEAILIAENKAGLVQHFRTNSYTVDWTEPYITDIKVNVNRDFGSNESFVVSATWNVVEEESSVNDCLWFLGSAVGESDFLQETPTNSMLTSTVTIPEVQEGDNVYCHIRCHNIIGLYSSSYELGKAISKAPLSDDAFVTFVPEMKTDYKPQVDMYQSGSVKQLQFSFHGFQDVNITGYSYIIEGSGISSQWYDLGLVDTVLIVDNDFVDDSAYTFKVRATNDGGFWSDIVENDVYLMSALPTVTGNDIQYNLVAGNLHLDWADVFSWDDTRGTLLYEIQVGPVERSLLYINTQTFDISVKLTSHTFESPGRVYAVLTAVTPSGEFVRYNEVLDF